MLPLFRAVLKFIIFYQPYATYNDLATSVVQSFCFVGISCRHAGEGGKGSMRLSCLSVGGAGGAKVPFLNAMICFPIVNMIQRR